MRADELLVELEADPEFRKARAKRDEEQLIREREYREEERPVVEALQARGYRLDSVWDLVNRSRPYSSAIPTLLEHLERPYSPRVREGISRALAVPDASDAVPRLLELYRAEPDNAAKNGLAVALAFHASKLRLEELLALVASPQYGPSRIFLLRPLSEYPDDRADSLLRDLESDPYLGREARSVRHSR
jgi:hypothetical protein